MPIRAVIFDIDGTLVDTNPAHVRAWWLAFDRLGQDVSTERIEIEIGKGGDLLVPAILGQEMEKSHGDTLRKAQKEEYLKIAKAQRFRVFPRVLELFQALRKREIRSGLATSSDQKQLDATFDSAGIDLSNLADVLVTKDEAETSKPAPDLVVAAREKLSVTPAECVMVGDTIYDAQACQGAGVVFLGLESGGTLAAKLREAGASGVWRDTGHLCLDLDQALELASLAMPTSR